MQKLLIIDGAYFGQRVLGQVNMGDSVNNIETPEEKKSFKIALKNSLVNLYKTFNNQNIGELIDQIIFVTDFGSWRKDIQPYRPYYLENDNEKLIGYKEQRKAKKEESPINYNNFYEICREFVEDIRDLVVVFDIEKLEGDDNIMLVANKLKSLNNVFGVVFANDGDLDQVVKDNVCIFRNIKSSRAPQGEFVITNKLFGEVFEQSQMDMLIKSGDSTNTYYKELFKVQLGCTDGNQRVNRTLNNGIVMAKPFRTALLKSIIGDPKDNIFSLLSWKSSTGTKDFKISEKKLLSAFERHNYDLTENSCKNILTTKDSIFNILYSVREICKQTNVVEVEEMGKHLKHNLRINMLSVNNVPAEYLEKWELCWNNNLDRILNTKLDSEKINSFSVKQNYNPKNNATNILEDSIPELI